MCLSNLNVGLQPEQVIDAIAEPDLFVPKHLWKITPMRFT